MPSTKQRIILAAPTSTELAPLMEVMEPHYPDMEFFSCGVGPAATAHSVTVVLMRQRPCLLLLAGIGGAYENSGLEMGQVCLATTETLGDLGRCNGAEVDRISLPGADQVTTEFDLQKGWRDLIPHEALTASVLKPVPMATVSCSSGTFERARAMEKLTGAFVENMEGAAAALACSAFHTPLLEVRAISNVAGEADRKRWDIPAALENLASSLSSLLKLLVHTMPEARK